MMYIRKIMTIKIFMLSAFMLSTSVINAEDGNLDNDYRLSAGDEVRITVYGHEDLSGAFEVDGNGQLSLPLIQDVDASGKTLNELEAHITDIFSPDYLKNPRVSVEILNHPPFYIVGEVNEPGGYPYVDGNTVLNAVAMAGGFTYRARKSKILITRSQGQEKEDINATVDTLILPGDVIEVGERFF
jgi:protein involved in polysaccharide export with SLBB domain